MSSLGSFRTLGRSGLIVSPLALGTMTFGNTKWGSTDEVSGSIFHAYLEAGGNFIDTADVYAKGRCEELIGGLVAEGNLRDKLVIATKFTFSAEAGNPNAGGNGRKNMIRALEGSLRRLKTDYVDLYYSHFWDMITPIDEVLQSLGDLVRAGKIRYFGLSNVPAWYATKAATLASARAIPGPIALQMDYSLVERGIEQEHVPSALDGGLGVCAWGPLGSGFLTGKYHREGDGLAGEGRFESWKPFRKLTDQTWRTLDAVREVAGQVDRTPAQVAIAWAMNRPGISSVLLGASKLDQLRDNLAAAEVVLTPDQLKTLDEVGASDAPRFTPEVNRMIFGGSTVRPWR